MVEIIIYTRKVLNLIPWNFGNVGLGIFYKQFPIAFLNAPSHPPPNGVW